MRIHGGSAWWPAGGFGVLAVLVMLWHAPRAHDMVAAAEFAALVLLVGVVALGTLVLRGARPALSDGSCLLAAISVLAAVTSLTQSTMPLVASVRMTLYVGLVALGVAVYLYYRCRASVSLAEWCWILSVVHVPFLLHAVVDMAAGPGDLASGVGVFANIRHFGTAGFLAAAAASVLLMRGPRVSQSAWMLLVLALFGIVASGSRGPLLAWGVVVAALAVGVGGWRVRRRFVTATGLALTTASLVVVALHVGGLMRTPNIFLRADAVVSGEVADISSGRFDLWGETARQIASSPWFGMGPDAFRISECCAVIHPHNIALQFMLEFGLVGLTLLMAWLVVARGGLRARGNVSSMLRASHETRALTAMIVGLVVLSLVAGAGYWGYPLLHWPILLGLLAAATKRGDPAGAGHSNPSENAASRSWVE